MATSLAAVIVLLYSELKSEKVGIRKNSIDTFERIAYAMTHHPMGLAFCLVDALSLIPVFTLTCAQISQVFANITTNESMNMYRYPHFKAEDGSLYNPFDKGCSENTCYFIRNGIHSEETVPYDPKRALVCRPCCDQKPGGAGHNV